MKIENQVCTFDQALILKELGVSQTGYFTWMECLLSKDGDNFEKHPKVFRPNNGEYDFMTDQPFPDWYDRESFETGKEASAFTVAELGILLGPNYASFHDGTNWCCGEFPVNKFHMMGKHQAETMAIELISRLSPETLPVYQISLTAANNRLKND